MWVTENQLDQWVRGNARIAQGRIVELVWRLVAASCPRPRERRFPLGDAINQRGPDGFLHVDSPFDPFVPSGPSYWEIGTGSDAREKASSDYRGLVETIPETVRRDATFMFVTPLSGVTTWPHTFKEDAQAAWLEERRRRGDWQDVRVIDGTRLIDWIRQFPPVGLWLAQQMDGVPLSQVDTPEQRWEITRSIGAPPPMAPELFLANRDDAREKIAAVFAGTTKQLSSSPIRNILIRR